MGREGLVGIDTLLGSERALGRYVVPVSGLALAIEAVPVPERIAGEPGAARGLLRTTPRRFCGKRSRPQPATASTWLRSGVRAGC